MRCKLRSWEESLELPAPAKACRLVFFYSNFFVATIFIPILFFCCLGLFHWDFLFLFSQCLGAPLLFLLISAVHGPLAE